MDPEPGDLPDAESFGLVRAAPVSPPRVSGRRRVLRLLRVAGVVVGVAVIGLGVAKVLTSPARHVDDTVYLDPSAVRGVNGEVDVDVHVPSSFLQTGDCLVNAISGRDNPEVEVAPCSESHHGEVYAVTSMPVTDYPGASRAARLSARACARAFDTFVGRPESRSSLTSYDFYPTAAGFVADPSVRCVVQSRAAVTATLRNTAR